MAISIDLTLDSEDAHDLLIALDAIEQICGDGDAYAAIGLGLLDIRDRIAEAIAGQTVCMESAILQPTNQLREALVGSAIVNYRKTRDGRIEEQ